MKDNYVKVRDLPYTQQIEVVNNQLNYVGYITMDIILDDVPSNFDWAKSPEGYNYWSDIYDDVLRKIKDV